MGKGKYKQKPVRRFAGIFPAVLLMVAVLVFAAGCSVGKAGDASGQDATVSEAGAREETEGASAQNGAEGSGGSAGVAVSESPEAAFFDESKEESSGTGMSETVESGQEAAEGEEADREEADPEGTDEADREEADLEGTDEAGSDAGSGREESKGLVVIDPGHQQYADLDVEPVGPGASETKIRVSGGTTGTATGVPEYQLALDIGILLRDELLSRGYEVMMTRESNEVDISNAERAEIANEADADVFIRLHANGIGDSSHSGAMTICQTPSNEYNGELYPQSRALSDCVLDAYTRKTGIIKEYVWETDTMSGINWCGVPVTILEMGYMSNAEEDLRMQDPEMQEDMVDGIAEGIDAYFSIFPKKERGKTGDAGAEEGSTQEQF